MCLKLKKIRNLKKCIYSFTWIEFDASWYTKLTHSILLFITIILLRFIQLLKRYSKKNYNFFTKIEIIQSLFMFNLKLNKCSFNINISIVILNNNICNKIEKNCYLLKSFCYRRWIRLPNDVFQCRNMIILSN